jgi:hypothetical protein
LAFLEPGSTFDIKLEYNSNLNFLYLTNINTEVFCGEECGRGMAWLLRFFSSFDTSNKLELIQLQVSIDIWMFRDACLADDWCQLDCILAGKFQKLQRLGLELVTGTTKPEVCSEISQFMLDAHPLLLERGVEVDVWCNE